MDSGIRSGLDAVRAMAMGAEAVFCGRAFLWALAALGDDGATHFAQSIAEELRVALAQSGLMRVDALCQAAERPEASATMMRHTV